MGEYGPFLDSATLRLLKRAGAVLDDEYWWAIIADGALCGDDKLAALSVELGAQISRSDPRKRAGLVARLHQKPGRLIDAADFFDGNEDNGSIGCNLDPHPGLSAFRRVISQVAKRRDVSAVKVAIREITDEPDWPFTDTVLVCTSAPVSEVEKWFRPVRPDSVAAAGEVPASAPEGSQWLAVWWD